MIRQRAAADVPAIEAIVNEAAKAYRGIIPADRWHEPYMPRAELEGEIAAGVDFWGFEESGRLVGARLLVGTWAAAQWAIRFYERDGFRLVAAAEKDRLLDAYWTIPERQRETSVVLVRS